MKKLKITLIALCVFCCFQYKSAAATGGSKNLPTAVSSAFSRKYPAAKMNNWTARTNGYVINFTSGNISSSAYYSTDGTWLRTDTKLSGKRDLPEAVRDGLAKSQFSKYFVDKMEKVRQPDLTLYLIQVDYGGNIDWDLYETFSNLYILYFSPDGKLLKALNAPSQMPTKPSGGQ